MKAATVRSATLALACAALVGTVASSACRSQAPRPQPAKRVVLLSLDGLGADTLDRWSDDPSVTSADGLAGMVQEGVNADRVHMVNPTLTAVNHATLITGAEPGQTGIVSNGFRTAGEPVTSRTNGFAAPFEAETLWQRARTAGIRTGVLLWPGADASSPERTADFGIRWPDRSIARPRLHELSAEDAEPEPELPPQDGVAAHRWRVPVQLHGDEDLMLEVAVLDATPDGLARFDTVAVRRLGEVSYRYLEEREWFETRLTASEDGRPKTWGAWSKVLHLDRLRGEIRLYRGAFDRLYAYPDAFENALVDAVGPWPGTPDERRLADWWLDAGDGIDLDTYLEQLERLDRYLDDVASWVMEHEDFDFLIAYHPAIDEYQHSSLIAHRDQWAWSEGRAFAAARAFERVGRSADEAVANLWARLDASRDVLVVVSDHGLVPIHDEVRLNQALADAGLVKTEEVNGRLRAAPDTPMVAHTSGAAAHVYVNLQGRDPGGVVSPDEADGLMRRAARALADLSVDGAPVVEEIVARQELSDYGLDHPNSGDLVVFLMPGYAASSRLGGDVISPSRYYGQHGYLNHHPEMDGIFLARGEPAGRGRVRSMKATDVAPMVAAWLGIELTKAP